MKACSFTGHRQIEREHIKPLEELLSRAIDYVYNEGCRTFYTGGALGFDTLAAKLLIKKRIFCPDVKLIVVIPCIDQSENWGYAAKQMYDYIASNADEVIFTSESYTRDCMKKRNEKLVEFCDVLIAYSGREYSGSAQTVRMAKKAGKTVYNLFWKEKA